MAEPSGKQSPTSSPGTAFTSFSSSTLSSPPPSAEVQHAQSNIENIQGGISNLENAFEGLIGQILQGGTFGGDPRVAAEIREIQASLKDQDSKHKNGVHEIQLVMQDFIDKGIVDELRKQVNEEVNQDIDRLVEEEVAKHLETLIPTDLQQSVQEKKEKLDEYRRQLHNSESKRANSLLRNRDRPEQLHTLFKADGTVSALFPKTLQDLFSLDAKTCHTLVQEYGLSNALDEENRDANLNRFMVFCGVQYQKIQSEKPRSRKGGRESQ
ncbi:hypothetical protein K435DRAFT_790549 [Dendrothele bispora CBS 962.96]|uniref:Uncharacterized protein n=1 Tax=Dendrothele bispora (strain CBS 962.96) TaxID=1314807 RepID=A0A4S8MQE3_DENBC|nr:hypothetical protein K435DRAFT_790549 [Dendrothele bispora CBS 962.96]